MPHTIERTAGLGGPIRAARQVQIKWRQNESAGHADVRASHAHAAGKEPLHD